MTVRPNIVGSDKNLLDIIPAKHTFKTMPDEKNIKLFYGCELEVLINNPVFPAEPIINWEKRNKIILDTRFEVINQAAKDLEDVAIFKPDGSFEIVTVPASLRFHKESLWENFFANSATKVSSPAGYGLHIHFSRNALTDMQLAKVIAFFHENFNSSFLTDIAGRTVSSTGLGYAPQFEQKYIDAAKSEGAGKVIKVGGDGRKAIHISKRNAGKTVEARIFQGNPTRQGVFQALEFLDALILYCLENGSLEKQLHHDHFIKWFSKEKMHELYPYLQTNLERLKYVGKIKKSEKEAIAPAIETTSLGSYKTAKSVAYRG